jgi:hypothetical protein
MDADLRLLDVTGDGVPEILFNSGSQGASEGIIAEHVLRYESSIGTFKDISLDAFYNSSRNGFAWLTVGKQAFGIVAKENWDPSVPIEERCHYCLSPFGYSIYVWSKQGRRFLLTERVLGKRSYSTSREAVAGDWPLIQSAVAGSGRTAH